MFQLIRNDMNIPFVKYRWFGFILSGILVSLGVIALVQIARGQARMGVDFGGGTAMEIEFEKPITADALRKATRADEFQDVTIQNVTDPGRYKYMIRLFSPTLETGQVSTRLIEVVRANVPDNPVALLSSEDVGPGVSAKLREQALLAVFWAMVGILVYIWWRFDFRFAVAATAATVHDVLAVLGIYFLMGNEINLLLITALLTIAGYSLNDTVVVFDRIRENLRHNRKEDYVVLANTSINQTLSRTIITALATLFVVVSLFFLGGEVIHPFATAMMIGMFVGTYSTIFVAGNMLAEWHMRSPVRR